MSEFKDISSRSRFLWDAAHLVPGTSVSRILINCLLESAEVDDSNTLLPSSVVSQCCAVCGNLLSTYSSSVRWAGRRRGRRVRHRSTARKAIVKCNVCLNAHCVLLKKAPRQTHQSWPQACTSPLPSTPQRALPTPTSGESSTCSPKKTPVAFPLKSSSSQMKKKRQQSDLKKALQRQRSASEPITSPDLKSFLELLSSP